MSRIITISWKVSISYISTLMSTHFHTRPSISWKSSLSREISIFWNISIHWKFPYPGKYLYFVVFLYLVKTFIIVVIYISNWPGDWSDPIFYVICCFKVLYWCSIVLKIFIDFHTSSLLFSVEGIGTYFYIRYYRYKQPVLPKFWETFGRGRYKCQDHVE